MAQHIKFMVALIICICVFICFNYFYSIQPSRGDIWFVEHIIQELSLIRKNLHKQHSEKQKVDFLLKHIQSKGFERFTNDMTGVSGAFCVVDLESFNIGVGSDKTKCMFPELLKDKNVKNCFLVCLKNNSVRLNVPKDAIAVNHFPWLQKRNTAELKEYFGSNFSPIVAEW